MLVLIRKVSDFRYIYKGWPISKNSISTLYIPHIYTDRVKWSIGGSFDCSKNHSLNLNNNNNNINNRYNLGLNNLNNTINTNTVKTRSHI